MLIDKNALLSDAQAVTTTAASTSYYDHSAAADRGPGTTIRPFCTIPTAWASATSLTVAIETDSDPAFGTAVVLTQTPAIALASLVAGKKIDIAAPTSGYKRYTRFKYTVSGTENAGTINSGFVIDQDANVPTLGSP